MDNRERWAPFARAKPHSTRTMKGAHFQRVHAFECVGEELESLLAQYIEEPTHAVQGRHFGAAKPRRVVKRG
jgi:hypothetical protein